jgi:4-amino-4-deoxy-L-arabinose transferase-like glycosyltransferase
MSIDHITKKYRFRPRLNDPFMITRFTPYASRFLGIKTILALFLLLGLSYSLFTPLFETPDEMSHFAYIKSLVDGQGFPGAPVVVAVDRPSQESTQPPLYYLVSALFVRLFAPESSDFQNYLQINPAFPYIAKIVDNDNKNLFIHETTGVSPFSGTARAVHVARLIALLFGALTVGATYRLACEACPEQKSIALIAASVVAFIPQFVFISGAASNDSAAAATCALTLWLAVKSMRDGLTPKSALATGGALGLAALSKASATALIPCILFFSVVLVSVPLKVRVRWAAIVILIVAVMALLWYLRSLSLFGDVFGIPVHMSTPWAQSRSLPLLAVFNQLPGVLVSFWLAFGWGNVLAPDGLYSLLNLLSLVGVVGLFIRFRSRQLASSDQAVRRIAIMLGAWIIIILLALIRWIQLLNAPIGRLTFPAIAAFAVLLAIGWQRIAERVRQPALAALMPICLVAISIWALPMTLLPAYEPPGLLTSGQIDQQPGRTLDIRYGAVARLIKIEVLQSNWPLPGDEPAIRLCWEALSADARPLMILLQLVGADNRVVATRRTLPGLGSFPTANWRVGDRFCDVVHVGIDANAPAPAIYKVEVAMIDDQTHERLPVFAPDGSQLTTNFVDTIKIAPEVYSTPKIDRPLNYRLGDQIELIGYSLEPASIERGGSVHLRLYWRALKRPVAAYTVFVHVQDDQARLLTQADSQPQNDLYPTSFWGANEIVIDDRSIQIPATASPGAYTIAVGLYNPIDNLRLPVNDVPNSEIDLPLQVQVR